MFGLGLILSFSLGLSAVLLGIGLLLVRSRSLLDRFGSDNRWWSAVLPLASAVVVTLLSLRPNVSGRVSSGQTARHSGI